MSKKSAKASESGKGSTGSAKVSSATSSSVRRQDTKVVTSVNPSNFATSAHMIPPDPSKLPLPNFGDDFDDGDIA